MPPSVRWHSRTSSNWRVTRAALYRALASRPDLAGVVRHLADSLTPEVMRLRLLRAIRDTDMSR